MSFYFSIFTLTLLYSCGQGLTFQADRNSCQTPDNHLGRCTALAECPYLHEIMMSGSLNSQTADFIQKSHCGMENNSPKICCSHSDLRKPYSFYPTPAWITSPSWITQSNKPIGGRDKDENIYSLCGKSTKMVAKIIGGKSTTSGDWPWMVAIGFRNVSAPRARFSCGGTLISDAWILTASHCFHGIGKSTQTVARVGEVDLNKNSATDILVEKIILHPEFIYSGTSVNDIALLRLRNPVTFTAKIRPICLPKLNEYKDDKFYANKSAFIAGWGYTKPVWPHLRSTILLEAQVDIVDQKSCISKYKLSPLKSALIDDRVLCAGRRNVDSCQGDSGGPLALSISASYYLIGIVSYGFGCASPFFPGVYTKVAYYLDWIKSTTGIGF